MSEKFLVFACCRQFNPQLIINTFGLKLFKCNSRCIFAFEERGKQPKKSCFHANFSSIVICVINVFVQLIEPLHCNKGNKEKNWQLCDKHY